MSISLEWLLSWWFDVCSPAQKRDFCSIVSTLKIKKTLQIYTWNERTKTYLKKKRGHFNLYKKIETMYNFPKCEASETWTLKMFLILFVRNSRKTKCTQLIISFIYDTVTITLHGKIVMVKSGFMMNYFAGMFFVYLTGTAEQKWLCYLSSVVLLKL